MYWQKTLGFVTKFQLRWKTEQNYQSETYHQGALKS